jgi:hypothetical protein
MPQHDMGPARTTNSGAGTSAAAASASAEAPEASSAWGNSGVVVVTGVAA